MSGETVIAETVVVVPCYNEAARLDLAAFAAFLEHSDGVALLLVDDGSTDETPRVLERLRAAHPKRIAVLGLGANVGKAEAVRRGVKLALSRGPALVGYWDADLATPLEAIVDFRTVLAQRPEVVLVMGSRVALLGRQIRRSWKRHFLGRAFATAASLILGLTVYDTQCGAKLFRVTRQTAALFDRPFRARWIFDVEILARIEQQPYHWPVGRTLFQKIAYVSTNEGLPTGLQYQRGSFGPFSGDLKALEAKLVNNGLLQEERRGKMFMVTVGPNFSRIRQKYVPLFDQWNKILDKTADLFTRVNTEQAEIIATVLFAAKELTGEAPTPPSETTVLEGVMQWKQKRRPPLDRSTVASTIRNLATLRWLTVKPDPNLLVAEEEALLA